MSCFLNKIGLRTAQQVADLDRRLSERTIPCPKLSQT